ncbi:MAG TPA: hypothetical protein VF466_05060 [Candidatus Saccharimonadales bacterium]
MPIMNESQLAAQRAMLLADGYSVPPVGELGVDLSYLHVVPSAPAPRPAPTITKGLLAVEATIGLEAVDLAACGRTTSVVYLPAHKSQIGDEARREAVGYARRELSWLALHHPEQSFTSQEQLEYLGVHKRTPEVNSQLGLVRSWWIHHLRIAGYPLIRIEHGDIQANPRLSLIARRLPGIV